MTRRAVAYGALLDSEIDLPELAVTAVPAGAEVGSAAPLVRIRTGTVDERDAAGDPVAELLEEDEAWARIHRAGPDWVLSFDEVGRFRVAVTARGADVDPTTGAVPITAWDVVVEPDPLASPETVRHALLDQIVPRLVSYGGDPVLHASAVDVGPGVVALVGPSGSGKSTIAGALVAAGGLLVADDAVRLRTTDGRWTATGAYPGLRLWDTSAALLGGTVAAAGPVADYTSKGRFSVDGLVDRRPLVAVLFIINTRDGAPDEVDVLPVSGGVAVAEMLQATFVLDTPTQTRRLFEQSATLAADVPMGLLSVPDRLETLPDVVVAVHGVAVAAARRSTA